MTRYRILVCLLVTAAILTGYLFSQPHDNSNAAGLPLVVGAVVLTFFVAKPELYNSGVAFFQPGGVARVRKRAIQSMLLGAAFLMLGIIGLGMLLSVFAGNPILVDQLQRGGGLLVAAGAAALCGGFFAWCIALFLNRA